MDFDQHVFISYAHLDDTPLSPQQQGWVTRFHATLEALLGMRLGRPAKIWRDDRLRGHHDFAGEIGDQFGHTALMISVLTPRYIESDWCTRELSEFCEQATRTGGLMLENKSRVLKVLKVPIDESRPLPPPMNEMLGYPFFIVQDGTPLELDEAYGETFAQDYRRMVCKLAWDAAQLLRELEGIPAQDATLTVYLAACSHDCQPLRERIEADLKRHGYRVLPDRRLPLEDEQACVALVEQWLDRTDLALHLVGRTPGTVPDGDGGESIVVLQNRLAAQHSRARALPRLIWLPDAARSDNPAHQAFIEALHGDSDTQAGADLLTGGIDTLLQALHDTLDRLKAAASASPVEGVPDATLSAATDDGTNPASPPTLYLICVEADRKGSLPLRRHLRDLGVDVELPAFEGSASAVRESNRQLLGRCGVALVYYGAGDEAWKRSVDGELRQFEGLAGRARLAPVFTYLAEPRTADKEDLLDMQEVRLIGGLAGLPTEAALDGLLAALSGAQASA